MTQTPPQCQNLGDQVESLLQLLSQEQPLRSQDITPAQASLRKAISPTFEIVFAGAFSAGKSMLINALLGRELLYSAEGHATGTECYIAYAEQNQEKVILTFLSAAEIKEQAIALCQRLELKAQSNIDHPEVMNLLCQECKAIIQQEGGENKAERAKQAKALLLLVEGYETNRKHIHKDDNATYAMEQFNFSNLKDAAGFARRGSNSAVLKQIRYYCHHPLLQDGNVIVDTPGIDAPVQKDAEQTYRKIENPDTSAVVCVLKSAAAGDMTKEETELLEKMRNNPGIRDRVFYAFNRIDETWYNDQLRRRLNDLIGSQFQGTARVYKTSGLLGFYGSQIKQTTERDRFGLDSIFAESVRGIDGQEETPQFVHEFNRYCLVADKLSPDRFPIPPSVLSASANEKYVQILRALGTPLIDQLIQHSGVEEFRTAINRYLTAEKRPQLFAALADDLQPLCISLRKHYMAVQRDLVNQPRKIDAIINQELQRLNQQLQQVGQSYRQHMAEEVNQVVTNGCDAFEADFAQLQSRMHQRLNELLATFSVTDTYRRATLSHSRNATAPIIAVLVEALYYLANQLEDILVETSQDVVTNFFQRLTDRIRKSEYYRQLYRLLGNDGGVEQQLKVLENQVSHALVNAARTECDRFVRESPQFYNKEIFSIYQFRSALQQIDCKGLEEIEPAIRQLLKSDFEPKVDETLDCHFRQIINQTIKNQLLPAIESQANELLQQHDRVRMHLGRLLRKEAEDKIANNRQLHMEVHQKMKDYKQAVVGINKCLQAMQLHGRHLPVISDADVIPLPELEILDNHPTGNGAVDPKGMSKAVKA